ncbi:hypothetical protein M407DRAFT_70208 [Tulasnella calospora MUT 4182]|uniref:Cytochrome P450 n=1 Tax=Tulasnella calospora MUT 4182 TaxID=1051891 RepID=A0A0C3QNJ9_9AGAM|nr:hypothetical protein M407DRAFT_70208 [Tulasnella calospora MUT 4182]
MDRSLGKLLTANAIPLGASSLVLLYFLRKYWNSATRPPFPPGPRGLPTIGNLADMPQERFALTYSKWGEKYGPVTWITVPGQTIVIVNTYDAMCELLDKRGVNYIDRPRIVMIGELVGLDFVTVFLPGDTVWKEHRRLLKHALSPDTIRLQYSNLLVSKGSKYVKSILHRPEDFILSLKRLIGETISELTYGSLEDENGVDYVTKHDEFAEYAKLAAAGYVVDLFPARASVVLPFIPSWFPGAKFKRDAKEWREHLTSLRNMMHNGIQSRMSTGQGSRCYITNLLADLQRLQDETGADVRDDAQAVHDSGFSFYQGDPSHYATVSVKTFLLAMLLHPGVQARAREEIDRVISEGQSPEFSDQDKMPYIRAVVLETLRWNPPAPLGSFGLFCQHFELNITDCFSRGAACIKGRRRIRWLFYSQRNNANP